MNSFDNKKLNELLEIEAPVDIGENNLSPVPPDQVDFTQVFTELKHLIETGNGILDDARYVMESESVSPDSITAIANVINALNNMLKEFTKVHNIHLKFKHDKELLKIRQEQRKELVDYKLEKIREEQLGAQGAIDVVPYNQESIIKHIEELEKNNKK